MSRHVDVFHFQSQVCNTTLIQEMLKKEIVRLEQQLEQIDAVADNDELGIAVTYRDMIQRRKELLGLIQVKSISGSQDGLDVGLH